MRQYFQRPIIMIVGQIDLIHLGPPDQLRPSCFLLHTCILPFTVKVQTFLTYWLGEARKRSAPADRKRPDIGHLAPCVLTIFHDTAFNVILSQRNINVSVFLSKQIKKNFYFQKRYSFGFFSTEIFVVNDNKIVCLSSQEI